MFIGFAFNATIERVTSPKVGGIFGNGQVARKIFENELHERIHSHYVYCDCTF